MQDEWLNTPSPYTRATLYYPLIGGIDPVNPHFFFERDSYPAYEMLIVMKGKGAFRHGAAWMSFGTGDCLIHNMRYPHAYRADPDDPCELHYLVFDGIDLANQWGRLFGASVRLFPAFEAGFENETAENRETAPIVRLLRSVLAGMREPGPHQEWRQSSLVYGLLMECARLAGGDGSVQPVPTSIERAARYIDVNYTDIGSIGEVASEAGLSVYHFIRRFKKHYGCTPKDYLLQKRINDAKRLLMLTDEAVGDVAGQSGFDSYNAFLQAFRNSEHCSPSSFRKNWKRG